MSVNVQDLELPQLMDVKRQLDEELSHLTNSFAQLKQAQAKFKSCIDSVAQVNESNKDKSILVPLTNSLYVPGKLASTDSVIIDVGTGYYVKKNCKEATKHYNDKVDFVRGNLETLQKTIQTKQDNLNTLLQIMQSKMGQQKAESTS